MPLPAKCWPETLCYEYSTTTISIILIALPDAPPDENRHACVFYAPQISYPRWFKLFSIGLRIIL